jgi:putative ABC transport system substrate-binding protein
VRTISRRQCVRGGLAVAGLGFLTGCGLVPLPLARPGPAPRIGLLSPSTDASIPEIRAFREGLHELGYVEGQNLEVEYRFAQGNTDLLAQLASELAELPIRLIVTHSPLGVQAAQAATTILPIVAGIGADYAVAADRYAHPGGQVTGLSIIHEQLAAKRVELLTEAVPTAARVAAIFNANNPNSDRQLQEVLRACKSLSLQLQSLAVRGPDDLQGAFDTAAGEGADGVVTTGDLLFFQERTRISSLALQHRLPMLSAEREIAEAGALVTYGANAPDLFRRAATYVDKILRGASPGDLPIQQPTTFDFVVNIRTAHALGITVPPSLLAQATDVIY